MELCYSGFVDLNENELIAVDGGNWWDVVFVVSCGVVCAAGYVVLSPVTVPMTVVGGCFLAGVTVGGIIDAAYHY
jgi:hypothetical protein